MQFTYYGHSAFLIEISGKKLLFDPFISHNPLATGIDVNKIEADYILISHGHGDHIGDAVSIAKRTGASCIACAEIAGWLQKQGVEKTWPMNHGGPISFDFGTVLGVNAIHSSSLPDGTYAGNPLGFVISTNQGNFYFAGDTALTMDMQLIPWWASLNFSILPIGGNFTMDVTDAIKASDFVQCNTVIGVHYDTFGFIKIDHAKALTDFNAAGKKLVLPKVGETILL